MKFRLVLILAYGFILSATSCGYRFGQGETLSPYSSISVPYVDGDSYGEFTNALVKRVSEWTHLRYKREGGDMLLKVKILEIKDENIGFRYDRNNKGELIYSIIPTETRLEVIAKLEVVEAGSGRVIIGPYEFVAATDFDHDYYASRHAVNIFSLGQLVDYDAAYDAAIRPLSSAFAEKIVDILEGA